MEELESLQPKEIWNYFTQILKIPRASGKEEKMIKYILDFAKNKNLEAEKDKAGNIIVRKKAIKGFENLQMICLQSHLDMVNEKNNQSKHNFEKDPIQAYVKGNNVVAKETTLGADNGIGIAMQLAILESKNIEHGPLECLFTVDEERGLIGASEINKKFIKSNILINLDSEDERELIIGCAGGMITNISMKYKTKDLKKKDLAYRIIVSGLIGGHSGDDIDKGRGNSIKILNRFLWTLSKRMKIIIANFEGGNLHNAIPRESKAIVVIPPNKEGKLKSELNNFYLAMKGELAAQEPNLKIHGEIIKTPKKALKRRFQNFLLNSLYACPNGVIEYSKEIKGLVETSSNLAAVKFIDGNEINILTSQRSSDNTKKIDAYNAVRSIFEIGNAKVTVSGSYPGWKPNMNSPILVIAKSAYKNIYKKEPVVRTIHAGLECGLFKEKIPELDIISLGPTITGVHSPDESLDIQSTINIWNLILEIIKNIPQKTNQ